MKTATYIRVSTNEQETRQQDEACFRYAEFKATSDESFVSLETYEDTAVSGTIAFAKRPGAGRLLQAVQRGEIGHIIVAKLDRLGRNAEDILRVVRLCEQHNTVIHFTDLGGDIITTGGSAGKMIVSVMAAFAEFERNRIQERITERMASKRAQCTIPGSWGELCGTVPYGWKAVLTDRHTPKGKPISELVLDHDEQVNLMTLIDQRYGPDCYVDGDEIVSSLTARPPSFKKLADWLNIRGIPNKSGTSWSAGSVSHVLNNTYTRLLIHKLSDEKRIAA